MEKIDKTVEEVLEYIEKDNLIGKLEALVKFLKNYKNSKQPTYRPYANAEEFLKASKEHGPYIARGDKWDMPLRVLDEGVALIDYKKLLWSSNTNVDTMFCNYKELFDKYKWYNDVPCGILEQ